MYKVIRHSDLPSHFHTNPTTIHFFLVHFFKKYYESYTNKLLDKDILEQDCEIIDSEKFDGEVAVFYYRQSPIVRLMHIDDEFEFHVLEADVSYKDARKNFTLQSTQEHRRHA